MAKKKAAINRARKRQHRPVDRSARKFVFWSSQEYPWVYGGVGLLEDSGMARIPTQGVYVKPVKVMEVDEGQALAVVLGRLKSECEAALTAVREGFSARLKLAAVWVKPPPPRKPSLVEPYRVWRR